MRQMSTAFRRLPRGALVCGLMAFLNAGAWSLLVPPFHVPDETAHVAYVQHFAETGRLPKFDAAAPQYSAEERDILVALSFYPVIGNPRDRPIWSASQDRELNRVVSASADRAGTGSVGPPSTNPPLYYVLEAVPYWISPSSSLLNRLVLMRLMSALMAAATVAAIFLFLREVFPRTRWVWPVGALTAAFQPTFAFISGGVNNDNLLFLAAAGLFLALARGFRRGLTPSVGAGIGAAVSIGLLTKFQFLGLVPAAMLGVFLLVARARPADRRYAARGALTAVVVTAIPIGCYAILSAAVWHRGVLPQGTAIASTVSTHGTAAGTSAREELSFIWQLFLPRFPGLSDQFVGTPLQTNWFNGLIGRFGWLDYGFPMWVYTLALWIWIVVLTSALLAFWRARTALRARLPELLTYSVAVAGLCLLIGIADYHARRDGEPPIEQARYLLPLLALYAAIVAAAARSGGRRWGPVVGAVLVAVAAAHSVFSELLTLTRFYG
jgi:4-amino-4-deoxy-L-arabinose transferase-like glycosyltransferase